MSGTGREHLGWYLAVGLTLAAIGVAGCDSEPTPKSARITKAYDGQFSTTISYQSFGATSAVDCVDGKSLNVSGSNNKLTVRGRCDQITVSGADNRITIERVDKVLRVTGLNNSITYRGGQPKIDDRGSGNTIADKR